MNYFKGSSWIYTHTQYVKMSQPSIYALEAIIRRHFEAAFSPSVVSTTFYTAQHQAARKPDWTSRKCSDVNQPSV